MFKTYNKNHIADQQLNYTIEKRKNLTYWHRMLHIPGVQSNPR